MAALTLKLEMGQLEKYPVQTLSGSLKSGRSIRSANGIVRIFKKSRSILSTSFQSSTGLKLNHRQANRRNSWLDSVLCNLTTALRQVNKCARLSHPFKRRSVVPEKRYNEENCKQTGE